MRKPDKCLETAVKYTHVQYNWTATFSRYRLALLSATSSLVAAAAVGGQDHADRRSSSSLQQDADRRSTTSATLTCENATWSNLRSLV